MADDQNPELPLTPPPGDDGPGALNIQPVNIEEEMKRSYLDYSMSVIIGRALPDVRDGLKPVHRRILFTMSQMGLHPNRATRKCARIVGEVMGKYHPHGNLAVYDALVRLAQDWSLRYPLIFGQGNFGSVDGDPPAADRYTEAKLAQVSTPLLEDLDKETVDFHPNYDGSEVEPDVLPARIPNLLVNGSDGIAVGMATKIPPHNLTEIVDATITLVNNPNAQLAELLKFVQGPDFPTAGIINGRAGIFDAYKTGRGRFMMRAKAAIETFNKDRQAIIVTEIPYQVNKSVLIKRIAQLVNDKTIEDISDVRDESDRDGMRIVIELKRGAEAQIVLNQLFKHTQMQESFSMILLAVVNAQPREMGLIQTLKYFIEHRVDVVRRRTAYLLQKAKDREHILEGYLKALDHLDNVITIIRGSANRADARENLILYFGGKKIDINTTGRTPKVDPEKPFTARQADAILELQLHRLTKLSIDEISKELGEVRDNIAEFESILGSEAKLRNVIVKELEEVKKLYGDARRTRIEDEAAEILLEDLIADEQVAVTVSHYRLPEADADLHLPHAAPRRHGPHRHEDARRGFRRASLHRLDARLHSHLHQQGPRLLAEGLRNSRRQRRGQGQARQQSDRIAAGRNCPRLPARSQPRRRRPLHLLRDAQRDGEEDRSQGLLQRDVARHHRDRHRPERRTGRRHAHRRQPDHLHGLARRAGNPLRRRRRALHGPSGLRSARHEPRQGRLHRRHGDHAERSRRRPSPKRRKLRRKPEASRSPRPTRRLPIKGSLILSVAENGYGKRTPASEYRLQGRGGSGVINIKTTERIGKVVGIAQVDETSQVMLISHYGKIIRMDATTIRESGRNAQGVRLLNLEPGDKVAAAVVIAPEPETNGNGGPLIQ